MRDGAKGAEAGQPLSVVDAVGERPPTVNRGDFRPLIKRSGTIGTFVPFVPRQEAVGLAADLQCSMPMRQTDLADATDLTTVHVSRVLKALGTDGLITLRNRLLIIRDWERLYDAAEFDPTYLHVKDLRS